MGGDADDGGYDLKILVDGVVIVVEVGCQIERDD